MPILTNIKYGSTVLSIPGIRQYTTLPTPTSSSDVAVYIGETTPEYTKGCLYFVVVEGDTYKWSTYKAPDSFHFVVWDKGNIKFTDIAGDDYSQLYNAVIILNNEQASSSVLSKVDLSSSPYEAYQHTYFYNSFGVTTDGFKVTFMSNTGILLELNWTGSSIADLSLKNYSLAGDYSIANISRLNSFLNKDGLHVINVDDVSEGYTRELSRLVFSDSYIQNEWHSPALFYNEVDKCIYKGESTVSSVKSSTAVSGFDSDVVSIETYDEDWRLTKLLVADSNAYVQVLSSIPETPVANESVLYVGNSTYVSVSAPETNPAFEGYYEREETSSEVYVASTDTEIDSSKTYYTLKDSTYQIVDTTSDSGSPSEKGWYEKSEVPSYAYVLTTDTTVDSSKTYYEVEFKYGDVYVYKDSSWVNTTIESVSDKQLLFLF